MPTHSISSAWSKGALILTLCLFLAACATPRKPEPGTWAGRPIGTPPAANPAVKRAMISRATREWQFFGGQRVIMEGRKESIPEVAAWEDDDSRYSSRVNRYWRAVGKPSIYGVDCRQPWSAAFMGWVMGAAGVPESQFLRVPAHWIYLSSIIENAVYPGRYFVPRRVTDYSPNPGDLICAYRGHSRRFSTSGYATAEALRDTPTHCDLVVRETRVLKTGCDV